MHLIDRMTKKKRSRTAPPVRRRGRAPRTARNDGHDKESSTHAGTCICSSDGEHNNSSSNSNNTLYHKMWMTKCESDIRKAALVPINTREDFADDAYETKAVHCLKMLLLVLLCTLAVVVAVVVFFISRSGEVQVFQEVSSALSFKVLDGVGYTMLRLTLGSMDGLATTIASHAQASNSTWPFVELPNHAVHFAKVRATAKAMYMCTIPVVTLEDRYEWENDYSIRQGRLWVNNSLEIQKEDPNYHGIHLDEYEPSREIYDVTPYFKPAEGPGPFLPSWQAYPVVPRWAPFNWDYATYTIFDKHEVISNLRVSLSKVLNMPDSDDPWVINEADVASKWAIDFVSPDQDPDEPWFHIFYPIVADAGSTLKHPTVSDEYPIGATEEDISEPKAVGVLTVIIYFKDLLSHILPPDSAGLQVVVENTCNQSFTYELDGPTAQFMGRGDLHDPAFDSLEHFATLTSLEKHFLAEYNNVYAGFPLSERGCQYNLRLYPSSSMKDKYMTANPATYTSSFVVIFMCVVIIFLLFDRCVERKNRKVMYFALQRLEEANDQVIKTSAVQLERFASMSHEIRTPLSCIVGMSNLILESKELNETTRESMEMISGSSDLLLTVVNDVLDLSKLESDVVEIKVERTDFRRITESVTRAIEYRDAKKEVTFRIRMDENVPPYFDTDKRRLQQVMFNLLSNAQKFSKPGGLILLTVSYEEHQSFHQHTGILSLSVKDFGRGISKEDMLHIFEPFNQGSNQTEEKYAGTGLGLAISSKLVSHLGGTITVDSDLGEWTDFVVSFPVVMETFQSKLAMHPIALPPIDSTSINLDSSLHSSSESRNQVPMEDIRVLSADDNTINRKLLRKILLSLGIQNSNIEDAKDGQEAVDMTAENVYDVVFMDVDMPRLSGIEATRIIKGRQDGRYPMPKIFFVTAHSFRSYEVEAEESGGDGYITKPYSKESIRKGLLSVRRPEDA